MGCRGGRFGLGERGREGLGGTRTKIQAAEFFATKRRENYQGFDFDLPRPYKGNGDPAAASEIFALFVAKKISGFG